MDVRGRRVLITGASRGIGEALAKRFAQAGATVALMARSAGEIEKLAAELGGTAHPTDLADPAQVATVIQRVEDEAGPVDVLVNNAGIDLVGAFATCSASDLERIYRLNLVTPAELCRQAIPRMLRRGRGHIVNVSSLAGDAAMPGIAAYSSTKAGLTHLTAGLRADLKKLPIGLTVVELGTIPTDMLEHVNNYEPTQKAFRRVYRLGLMVDTSKEKVADEVVTAVEKGRRHVRLPRRAWLFSALPEAPRRMIEVLLTGVKHQAD